MLLTNLWNCSSGLHSLWAASRLPRCRASVVGRKHRCVHQHRCCSGRRWRHLCCLPPRAARLLQLHLLTRLLVTECNGHSRIWQGRRSRRSRGADVPSRAHCGLPAGQRRGDAPGDRPHRCGIAGHSRWRLPRGVRLRRRRAAGARRRRRPRAPRARGTSLRWAVRGRAGQEARERLQGGPVTDGPCWECGGDEDLQDTIKAVSYLTCLFMSRFVSKLPG